MIKLEDIEFVGYDRSEKELQIFILFAISVAGKQAKIIIKALNKFFDLSIIVNNNELDPFQHLSLLDKNNKLDELIMESKLGQHKKLGRAFRELYLSNINLKTCSVEELEKIHGISFKTSRFFLSFNRNVSYAILDTHILAEMKELGYDVPKSTPPNYRRYAQIEQWFIEYANRLNLTPSELDLQIWLKRSKSL